MLVSAFGTTEATNINYRKYAILNQFDSSMEEKQIRNSLNIHKFFLPSSKNVSRVKSHNLIEQYFTRRFRNFIGIGMRIALFSLESLTLLLYEFNLFPVFILNFVQETLKSECDNDSEMTVCDVRVRHRYAAHLQMRKYE